MRRVCIVEERHRSNTEAQHALLDTANNVVDREIKRGAMVIYRCNALTDRTVVPPRTTLEAKNSAEDY
jgi:hypothetical protein